MTSRMPAESSFCSGLGGNFRGGENFCFMSSQNTLAFARMQGRLLAPMVEPFPLIEISGAPRERGRQYGRQAADRIRKGTSHYVAQLKDLSLDRDGIASLVRDYLPVIEAFEPAYIEEMRGIAEGADVPFEDVVAAQRAHRDPQACRAGSTRAPDRAGRPGRLHRRRRAAAGKPGRPADPCPELGLEARMRRNRGRAQGASRRRARPSDVHRSRRARPLRLQRRRHRHHRELPRVRSRLSRRSACRSPSSAARCWSSEHLAIAMRTVYCTQKSAANNMIVSHREGVVIDFECAPDETFPGASRARIAGARQSFRQPGRARQAQGHRHPQHAGQPLSRHSRAGAASAAHRRDHARHGQGRAVRRFRERRGRSAARRAAISATISAPRSR